LKTRQQLKDSNEAIDYLTYHSLKDMENSEKLSPALLFLVMYNGGTGDPVKDAEILRQAYKEGFTISIDQPRR
jgi:hypothetical protein